jgi:hypothetical protein
MQEPSRRLLPEREGWIMGEWFQAECEKAYALGCAVGFAKGFAVGFARGFARGQAKALILFLERRFGVVSAPLRQRIFCADMSTLERWVDRAVDAGDLESIFYTN